MGRKKEIFSLRNLFFIIPVLLTIFGIFMIYESSSVTASRIYGDSFYFVKHQLKWFILAIGVFYLFYSLDYHILYNLSLLLLLGNIVLLILIFVPGLSTTVLGANRWLNIAGIKLQPSEFTKLTLITYLSAWFTFKERGRFFAFLLLTSFLIGLVMLQPDMGTAVILGSLAVFLYFLSGAPLSHFFLLFLMGSLAGLLFIITSPYRLERLMTFLHPETDPQGIGYHVKQINIALSLGGWLGSGFGSSKQKFQFLPEAHTDSIFAIVGENFGFIGTAIIIFTYLLLFFQIYKKIEKIKDRLGFFLASGILFLMTLQTFINLGAMVQILPLTGIPLPFISYGGSSLLAFYAMMGILLNIFKQSSQKR